MGMIYRENQKLLKNYPEETALVRDAVIEAGKSEVQVKLASMDRVEVDALLKKVDAMASHYLNETIAVIFAEEMVNILTAVRMVKTETKNRFGGIRASGQELDLNWLVPKDIGGSLLNSAATASKGLYGGTSGAVYTWLQTFTANTSDDLVPSQKMDQYAGMIYLGFIDPVEVPKVHKVKFTLSAIPTPPQPLNFRIRKDIGTFNLPVARLEQPVIIPPKKTQLVDVVGGITGDSKIEPLALLIAKAEDLSM